MSPTVLASLGQAVAEITKPLGGFNIQDQLPLTLAGSLLNAGQLAGLTVNGIDVLGLVGPDGSFVIPIPGTSREVTIVMTDKQGVTNTTTYPITHNSTIIQTPLGPSVSAAGALGVRITSVRYFTKIVRSKKQFRVLVTVKDNRGYLIRNATVTLKSQRPRLTVGKTRTKVSNKVGQVNFIMKVRPRALGKSVFVLANARRRPPRPRRRRWFVCRRRPRSGLQHAANRSLASQTSSRCRPRKGGISRLCDASATSGV